MVEVPVPVERPISAPVCLQKKQHIVEVVNSAPSHTVAGDGQGKARGM